MVSDGTGPTRVKGNFVCGGRPSSPIAWLSPTPRAACPGPRCWSCLAVWVALRACIDCHPAFSAPIWREACTMNLTAALSGYRNGPLLPICPMAELRAIHIQALLYAVARHRAAVWKIDRNDTPHAPSPIGQVCDGAWGTGGGDEPVRASAHCLPRCQRSSRSDPRDLLSRPRCDDVARQWLNRSAPEMPRPADPSGGRSPCRDRWRSRAPPVAGR